jgi:hypothetical protein
MTTFILINFCLSMEYHVSGIRGSKFIDLATLSKQVRIAFRLSESPTLMMGGDLPCIAECVISAWRYIRDIYMGVRGERERGDREIER